MNTEDFREAGRRLIDLVADYWDRIESRPVSPQIDRDTLFAKFEQSLSGDEGVGLASGVDELRSVVEASMAMSHPLYLGLVNSSPLPAAALGDLLVSALDNNGGASHQGPAQAAAERELIRETARRLGYGGEGMLLPGGSYATLQALHMAKAVHFPQWVRKGPVAVECLPRIYYADAVHFSVDRAAKVIGLGDDSLVPIRSMGRGELDPSGLVDQIQQDREHGFHPFAVVATAGTTGTGAIDPLAEIADTCARHNLWFHVDACYGGAAAMLDTLKDRFFGMHRADSVTVDLHIWFFMPLTAGVLLTRHEQLGHETFGVAASYIPDAGYTEAYNRGIPTSRRGSALAAWFGLRTMGWQVILEAIDQNIQLTRRLEEKLVQSGFRVMPDGELSIACARWEPEGMSETQLDQVQEAISDEVRRSGKAWFATTRHAGQTWLRFNLVNLHTRSEHIDHLAILVAQAAQRLTASRAR